MKRRQARGGAEADTFSAKARRIVIYLSIPGATSKIKRGARRRERRDAKGETRRRGDLY